MAVAAAAAFVARKNACTKRKGHKDRISFHLQLHLGDNVSVLEEKISYGETSVGWLRSTLLPPAGSPASPASPQNRKQRPDWLRGAETPEETGSCCTSRKERKNLNHYIGTKFEVAAKKFNNGWTPENDFAMWQNRLLIVTERRLFLASWKLTESVQQFDGNEWDTPDSKDLEIVDSIPMEEIVSVEQCEVGTTQWTPVFEEERAPSLQIKLKEWFEKFGEDFINKFVNKSKGEQTREDAKKMRKMTKEKVDSIQQLLISEQVKNYCNEPKLQGYYENFVRIVTHPEGFNRGHPFYFLLRKGSFLHWKKQKSSRPLFGLSFATKHGRANDATQNEPEDQRFVRKVKWLAAARHKEVERKTWFSRLQIYLQRIVHSGVFTMVVLALLISNFVFTVQQLENDDPSRQPYFEKIDMAYTIIFSIGSALLPIHFDVAFSFVHVQTDEFLRMYNHGCRLLCAQTGNAYSAPHGASLARGPPELGINFLAHALWPFLKGEQIEPKISAA
jgi:hypothetical protein